jgi:hypothetical protein
VQAAETQAASGNLRAARELLVSAVDDAAAALGPDHVDVLAASARLAGVHRELGALREARRVLEAAQEAGQRTHGPGHPQVLALTYALAVLAHELGNAYEAGRNFRLIERWGSEVLGAEHPHVLDARRYLGEDVPGEIEAPPPLPLPPVDPVSPAPVLTVVPDSVDPSTMDDPELRSRFRVSAAVAGMALLAVLAAMVAMWAIPQREARVAPPSRAAPVGPPPTVGVGDSESTVPLASLSASDSGVPVPAGDVRTPPRATPSTAPQTLSGRYLIHLAHTGMCVGLGPELFKNTGRTVLGQHACGSGLPQLSLEPAATNTYRILVTDEGGSGCADVDYAGTTEGLLLAPQECADGHADQRFTFEAVTTPVAGYRLRSVAGSRWCIGALEGKRENGVQLMQVDCNGGADQVFTLERR